MTGHSSTDLSVPWLSAALLLSKLLCVSHYINGHQTKPSADSVCPDSCVLLGALLWAIVFAYRQQVHKACYASYSPPFPSACPMEGASH